MGHAHTHTHTLTHTHSHAPMPTPTCHVRARAADGQQQVLRVLPGEAAPCAGPRRNAHQHAHVAVQLHGREQEGLRRSARYKVLHLRGTGATSRAHQQAAPARTCS